MDWCCQFSIVHILYLHVGTGKIRRIPITLREDECVVWMSKAAKECNYILYDIIIYNNICGFVDFDDLPPGGPSDMVISTIRPAE